jgi:serine/threonine protein phosphatase PrpC
LKITSAHASHPGLVRQNNGDCIRSDDNLGIYLLADGMGGHNAGEVASALAVDTVYAALSTSLAITAPDGLCDLMANAVHAAHKEIYAKTRTSLSLMGMGTTLVVAVVRDNRAYIAHAGDSRAYLFSPHLRTIPEGVGRLQCITNDHTMGDQLLANGIPREQILGKQFHTLTQAVGCGAPPIPDFNTVELNRGDLLLLCSDGLTDMLTDGEIEAVLSNGGNSLDKMADNLIDAANAKGGRDNVSVVLVNIP